MTLQQGDMIWVKVPWATFGLIVRDGRVVDAAPIGKWAIGQTEQAVAEYLRHRGATFVRLP